PDVLLPRGQGEDERASAVDIDRLPDQAPGHMPLQRFFDDHESDVRSAELGRNSPSLSLADTNLETVFPGRRYDPQRCRFRDDGDLDRAIRHRADGVIV